MKKAQPQSQTKAAFKLFLFAITFCVVILAAFVRFAKAITDLNLAEHVYYLVLVLLGVATAAGLFGILSSDALYEGKLLGGKLKLQGAVVGAALVVYGGYRFTHKDFSFPLTVYVHGEAGLSDIVLRNNGRVIAQLGPDTRSEPIGENGQAYLPAVPGNFRGKEVPAWVESDQYEVTNESKILRLDSESVYLTVKQKLKHYELAGIIHDNAGNPLLKIRVSLPDYQKDVETDRNGRFQFEVIDANQKSVILIAEKTGYITKRLNPTLGDKTLNFALEKGR